MTRFRGQSVLVTGASRGLGRAIALAFAREHAHVGIGFRTRADEARTVADEVHAVGGTADCVQFDVTDAERTKEAVSTFASATGLHVLVNNAAVIRDKLLLMMAQADWSDVLAANLTGSFQVVHSALPHLMRAGGNVVNVASIAGMRASPGQANYAAAKGGLLSMTTTLAAELAPRGVRVNAVVPGMLSTGMGERLDHRLAESKRTRIPLGRFGTGDEVAHAVLFLASKDASYIVGHHLVVDGGLSL